MGLFSFLKRSKKGRAPAPAAPRSGGAGDWSFLYSTSPALCVAAAYRCVRVLSESVAALPMQYLKLRGTTFAPTSGRLWYLLNVQSDAHMSAYDFWRTVVVRLLLDGNAYVVPVYGSEDGEWTLQRLAVCGRGTVSRDKATGRYTVKDFDNGISGVYREDEIVHVKGLSLDGISGMSVIAHAQATIDIAGAGNRETHERFVRGGNVRGMVTNNRSAYRGLTDYDDKELEVYAKNLDSIFDQAHIVGVPGDVDLKLMTFSSADMQFLESRKFTVIEICRFFGVPPTFVFADTSANYKSVEQANVNFLTQTLNPLLRSIETELLRKLVPESLAAKRKFQFDRGGLYACDLETRAKYQTARLGNGTATVNELRAEENLPPVEGGDKVFVSANLRTIDELTSKTDNPEKQDIPENGQDI